MEKMTKEQVRNKVEKARADFANVMVMIAKYGKRAVNNIQHGQLHIDFDDREGVEWNNDLLKLMPFELKNPVCITSWKGSVYAGFLDEVHCYSAYPTGEILTEIIMKYGEWE